MSVAGDFDPMDSSSKSANRHSPGRNAWEFRQICRTRLRKASTCSSHGLSSLTRHLKILIYHSRNLEMVHKGSQRFLHLLLPHMHLSWGFRGGPHELSTHGNSSKLAKLTLKYCEIQAEKLLSTHFFVSFSRLNASKGGYLPHLIRRAATPSMIASNTPPGPTTPSYASDVQITSPSLWHINSPGYSHSSRFERCLPFQRISVTPIWYRSSAYHGISAGCFPPSSSC